MYHGVTWRVGAGVRVPPASGEPTNLEYQMRRLLKNTIMLLPAAFLAACASPTSPEQAACFPTSRGACEAKPTGDYINPLADYINPLADYINPLAKDDTTNNGNGGN
jgi:hypothetical protein